jgi:hypothetical protein
MLAATPVNPPLKKEEGRRGEAAAQAADLLNVGVDSVYKAQKMLQDGCPELQNAVAIGKVNVTTAVDRSGLDKEEQADALKHNKATMRAWAKEGAQRKKAAAKKPAGNGVVQASGIKARAKDQDADAEFTDFHATLVKLKEVLERDQGGFAVQVGKLKPEDRDRLQEQMDSATDRLQKLRKESDANPTRT